MFKYFKQFKLFKMLKQKKITVITHPVTIGNSNYIPIPKKKCIVNKEKTYIFNIEISEVDL